LDVPLNEHGCNEVARVIDEVAHLKLEAVYAANCQPALATAEAVAKSLNVRLKKLDRLRNLDHGLWQGMRIDEVRRKQPKVYRQWQEKPQCICPPEGEMIEDAEERVRSAVGKMLKRHKDGAIGLVVSEPLASLVRRVLDQGELGDLWKAAGEHGRWEVIEVRPEALAHSS